MIVRNNSDLKGPLMLIHVKLIFNTAKYQGIDYKRQSALEKRLGTTFC